MFYRDFNGKLFTSMEAEICNVVYVADVQFLDDPDKAAFLLPPASSIELPTCPVCLERLDTSVSGVLTSLCNHSFHCACLSKWGDSSCPVCRYCQQPDTTSQCDVCNKADDLWICLICGYIGCGRYTGSHAYAHFKESQHTYAMEMQTQRVWDYAGDGYVHRLIQNRADGKLVELPGRIDESGEGSEGDDNSSAVNGMEDRKQAHEIEFNSKMEALAMEYNYLLTSQLDTQRAYFEEKITREVQEMRSGLSTLQEELRKAHEEKDSLLQLLNASETTRKNLDKRIEKMREKEKKTAEQLAEMEQMDEMYRLNRKEYEIRISALEESMKKSREEKAQDSLKKEQQIKELQEQVRDLMFYLEAQQTVQNSTSRDEIQQGHIVMPEAPPAPSTSTSRGRGRRTTKR